MIRKVHLHGALKKYGGPYDLHADTANEAARLLCANFPDMEDDFRSGSFHVIRGSLDKPQGLDEDTIHMKLGRADLHFVPCVEGSGGGNTTMYIKLGVKAVIGIALIATGVGSPAGITLLGTTISASTLILAGAGLILASAALLLAPRVSSQKTLKPENNDSFLFTDGAVNVSEQGIPFPLTYGEFMVGSNVGSAGITTEQIG